MPPLYTLWNTRLEKRWNIGSDDFVLPMILAIAVRLVGYVIVVGVLIYLYVAPSGCEDETLHTPPWLYGTLFATLLLELVVLINDAIIMSKSCRGRIHHYDTDEESHFEAEMKRAMSTCSDGSSVPRRPDPDSTSPRRHIKRYLCSRVFLFLLEIILSGLYGYACFSPAVTGTLLKCDEFEGPIYFARIVAVVWWLVLIISIIGWSIFLDPIGVCSPGLIDLLDFLDQEEEIKDPTQYKLFKFHRASLGRRRIQRRLKALFCCCLRCTQHSDRGVALEDAARVMQTIFNGMNLVGSDVIAGLILLNRDQKRKRKEKKCLVSAFKELTFKKMGEEFIPESYDSKGNCLVDRSHPSFTSDIDGYILLEDLFHYCHYAVGIYGWPLYVYGHMNCCTGLCGLRACCSLIAKTCGGCYCHQLARDDDIIGDKPCFCGYASVLLQSPKHKLKRKDIVHITFENDYFACPYLLCVDHAMKAVVVCIRGTLSFQDVLTDVTVFVTELTKDDIGKDIKRAYVHRGMYMTARDIKANLLNRMKPILRTTCQNNPTYRLVIVGHSLGAGVASILAVLLKKQFPDLICYAYSPPGCVFSFPLAEYSRDFITSVVIGNDIVPRLSIRALHYMKREIEMLLKNCQKPKHQVMFQPRWCDALCHMCSKETSDPSVCIEDIQGKIFDENNAIIEVTNEDETIQETVIPTSSVNRADSILLWSCCGGKTVKNKDGGDMYQPVKKLDKREKVPCFAPGDIVHFSVKHKRMPSCWGSCSVPVFTTSWMKSEDLGVIIADKGMIDHHMPTHVIDTLRAYHKHVSVETSELFTREWVDNQRNEQLMTTIRDKIEKREIQLEERADGMGSDEVDGGQAQVDGILEVEEVEQGWETAVDIEGRGVCDGSRVREPLGDGSLAGDMTDVADIPETLAGHGGSSDLVGGARVLAGEATDTETVLVVERYQNDDNEYFELHSVGTHNSNSV